MLTNSRLHRFVVSVAALMLLVQLVALYQGVPGALRGKANFRCLYSAGFMVRTGRRTEIYDYQRTQSFQQQLVGREYGTVAFDRPAYEALLFAPLSVLGYRTAYFSFFVLNLGFLAFAIRWLRPYLDKIGKVWRWGPVAVFLCFLPVGMSLIQGEDSIVLLTLLVASAVCFYRGWDFSAGVLLGLTLFQFQYSIPIALLFLLWRRWRILAGFCVAGAGCALVSVWITGLQGLKTYAQLLRMWNSQSRPIAGALADSVYSATIPNLRCLIHAMAPAHISLNALTWISASLSIVLIAWAATKPANFALAIMVAALVSYNGFMTDAVVLVVPIAMVLDSRLAVTSGRLRLWSRNIVGALFVAPSLFFLAGLSDCWLGFLMLFLLMPLRSTVDSAPPNSTWITTALQGEKPS
jgi:Glycosyltransferase family 87